jgi:thiol-disulfide isomerase/thioredoxin
MKTLSHTVLIIILFFCCEEKQQYIIDGSLSEKGRGDWVYLIDPGSIDNYMVDSAEIINQGFTFSGKIDSVELFLLNYQVDQFYMDFPIFLKPGKFNVTLNIQDFELGSLINGGRLNNEYQNFLNLANKINSTQRFEKAISEEDYMETYTSFMKSREEEKIRSLKYVRNNTDSPIAVFLLSQNKSGLSLEEKGEFIANFGEAVHHMSLYKMLKNEYDNQIALLDFTPAYEVSYDGLKQIDVDFGTSTIIHTLINQNPGKVMYIDLWATWCGPCRAAFNEIRALREDIQSDDLIFVYLCGESLKEKWERAIAKENLLGQHYLLGDGQLERLQRQLGRPSLGFPTYFIINRDGKLCRKKVPRPGSDKIELLLRSLISS